MPRIVVMSKPNTESGGTERRGTITLSERVSPADMQSEHHSAQLIERVGWAVHDADEVERDEATDHRSSGD
jgi:hypothetical protein